MNRLLPAVFGATIFLSASLLFSIQPLVGKELLPLLGGAPAVWNTVMVFFQAMLLAGYAYAHYSVQRLGVRTQPVVHIVLLLIAAACLPFSIRGGDATAAQITTPAIWALATLCRVLGIPVFVLASTAPLLQRWFASTRHPSAHDPYFLYAASNVGSFGALLAYPLLIEPFSRLHTQTRVWAYGFWLLVACMTACVWFRRKFEGATEDKSPAPAASAVSRSSALKWVGLSLLPSSLMLGVTNYITTDVASIPLLWVAPLALYLLTFVIAFSQQARKLNTVTSGAIPILALAVVFPILVQATEPVVVLVLLHLLFFFFASLQCHLQLARSRPPADQLTRFYLLLSLGGVLGGIFNALIAPVIFKSVTEYPLAIVAAVLVGYPHRSEPSGEKASFSIWPFALILLVMAAGGAAVAFTAPSSILGANAIAGVLLIGSFLFLRQPLGYTLALATLLAGTSFFRQAQSHIIDHDRNFFGVLRVSDDPDKKVRRLYHGTTIHGVQFTAPERRCEPLSYYHSAGPVGEVTRLFEQLPLPRQVALVGLGAGAMITYAQPGQQWTLYEIDPAVVRIAQDTNLFTYLSQCARASFKMELGDARLKLGAAPDHQFGLLFLDAFSSDVIPMHLLTVEAIRLYRQKVAANGILAFHLSSRHFELEPLVARLGQAYGLHCFASTKGDLNPKAIAEGGLESNWVILVSDDTAPAVLAQASWQRVEPTSAAPLWTDDFSSLLGVLKLN